jgi:16S rRNA (adenine1518-N6/adenine1519-N6)-dimethyltransferase
MHRTRRPKLGQHFLQDARASQKIADLLPIRSTDMLVEIGPGRGALTRLLVPKVCQLVAVELDPVLANRLREEYRRDAQVEIVEDDILKIDFDKLCERHGVAKCDVFGNLPYYITSPIVRHLLAARGRIRHITLLVQREVAQRMAAAAGSRDFGYLSVLVQCFSKPEILLEVAPRAFSPAPKVTSALVDLEIGARFPRWRANTEEEFLRFAQTSFRHKRKKLVNNLSSVYSGECVEAALQSAGLRTQARAEELSVEQLGAVFEKLAAG